MPKRAPKDQENVDALELLRSASGEALPVRQPKNPAPQSSARPAAARPAPAAPPPPPIPANSPAPQTPARSGEPPPYRCLNCGYPLADTGQPRCSECGTTFEQETLDYWFSGVEERFFDHVIWLVTASLFLRLLMLPELLWVSKLGTTVIVAWAAYLALGARRETTGGYYAFAGLAVAALLLVFAWGSDSLPFYTLDMIAGCVLLLAVLHDPLGGAVSVGGARIGRRFALALLFCTPLFAVACGILERVTVAGAPPTMFGVPTISFTLFGVFPIFTFLLPYLAAAAIWLFTWRTLVALRQLLFRPPRT